MFWNFTVVAQGLHKQKQNANKRGYVLQLDPTNSNPVISNSSLFRTKTHFPWTCSLVVCYQLF